MKPQQQVEWEEPSNKETYTCSSSEHVNMAFRSYSMGTTLCKDSYIELERVLLRRTDAMKGKGKGFMGFYWGLK